MSIEPHGNTREGEEYVGPARVVSVWEADLLICWYALGVVACGSVFAHDKSLSRLDILVCLILPPIGLPAIVAVWVKRMQPLDTSKQYLWRKP